MVTLPFATINEFTLFVLVLGRMAGLFAAIPLFGGRTVPLRVRMAAILAMSLVLFPVVRQNVPPLPGDVLTFALLVIRETLIGLTLGLLSVVIFAAVEFCGQMVGMQMGLSIATLFDPSIGTQSSSIAVFQNLLAMLLFMSVGAHYIFLRALTESYRLIPVGNWHVSGPLLEYLVSATGAVFVLAIKLSAPVMAALLATSVVLGIMARAFPQMNVFIVAMPLNIAIGFLILGLSLLAFVRVVENGFGALPHQIELLFRLLGQG